MLCTDGMDVFVTDGATRAGWQVLEPAQRLTITLADESPAEGVEHDFPSRAYFAFGPVLAVSAEVGDWEEWMAGMGMSSGRLATRAEAEWWEVAQS